MEDSRVPVARAVEVHRRVVAAEPNSPFYRYHLGIALINQGAQVGWDGDYDKLAELLEEALPLIALVERCHLGALAALESALEHGFRDAHQLRTAAVWEPLRDRPEFEDLLVAIEL